MSQTEFDFDDEPLSRNLCNWYLCFACMYCVKCISADVRVRVTDNTGKLK